MKSTPCWPLLSFLKSLSIYIFKLVHIRNTDAVFFYGLHFSSDHMCNVCMFDIYCCLDQSINILMALSVIWIIIFFLNCTGSSFVISYSIILFKKKNVTCFNKCAALVKLYHIYQNILLYNNIPWLSPYTKEG